MKKKKDEKIDFNLKEWSENLVNYLGGKDNILSASHCLTRLRLVLKDENIINKTEIENMKGVKGTFRASGQFQIVIGTTVETYFKEFVIVSGVEGVSKEENKKIANQQHGNWFLKSLNFLGEIFIPIVPVLVAGGIILGFRNILEADFDGFKIVESGQFWKGLNDFLWIPAQVCFWWLPVHICWSIFKKLEADQVLGIVVGLCLLVPPLLNVYEVSGAAGSEGKFEWIWDIMGKLENGSFDWGFMKYPWKIQYTAQVIPAFAIGIVGAYINKWIKRKSPAVVSQILVPLVTILPTFTLAMFVIGPFGFIVASVISFGISWAFTNAIAKYIFGFIIGIIYAPIVLTGVHHLFNAVFVQDTIQNGGNFLFIGTCAQAIAQGSAVLGYIIMNRKDPRSKDVGIPSVVSAYLGVTEPAMYGINLKHMYPFIAACIATGIGLEIAVISGVSATNSGNGAWLGILNVQVQSKINGVTTWPGTGYLWFMISMLVTAGASIGLTIVLSKIKYFKKFNIEVKAAELLK
ncbi:PTS transporter subunit EIIC [Spiroplasma turonicum]|uniref:PTS system, trehalose-specific IIB component PTS system, trehalose-specific IIC component n=1 Tax=Spiroplasma turonicum TaxID=216946 RepID=A0A0K1P6G6_9MOLU|nr:PTS transporter subunit EIIC [Spiroplasma turonicum]AKU79893.1 PTS system, trehalose-specific IIB component PTS system, trehalose-specific IIC component [Spiroplasma turonicum]ALX70904.1 PTS system, trehalose-specific IIBC component [Spiroplasma turonicum]